MLQKVNLMKEVNQIGELYRYHRIGIFNQNMLNVVNVADRTLDFHIHEHSDELFYVLEGHFQLEFEDGLLDMNEGDMVIVPAGTLHRPICTSLVKTFQMELLGTLNSSNSGASYHEND